MNVHNISLKTIPLIVSHMIVVVNWVDISDRMEQKKYLAEDLDALLKV